MDAGLAIIAGAAGLIAYKAVSKDAPDPNQPKKAQSNFLTDWMNQGDMPATGNGSPSTDQTGHDVAGVITGLAKFGTSLLSYFGTQSDNGSNGGGTSTGGPVETYGDGVPWAGGMGDSGGGSNYFPWD